jgi:hypothetical protein
MEGIVQRNTTERLVKFLRRVGFLEIIKNKEKFNQWIQDVTFEDFKKYLTLINGIVRDRPLKKRDMDGQNVFIGVQILTEK